MKTFIHYSWVLQVEKVSLIYTRPVNSIRKWKEKDDACLSEVEHSTGVD
jgi:hypothetical protein